MFKKRKSQAEKNTSIENATSEQLGLKLLLQQHSNIGTLDSGGDDSGRERDAPDSHLVPLRSG
eukprot:2318183-Amphidinium_carterae.1